MPVKKITKKFNYSKKDLIELVLKIDDYKNFLPWCINSKIQTIDKNKDNLKITADLEIGFKTFREVYTSKVLYNSNTSKIEVTSVSGNIKKLSNIWEFENYKLIAEGKGFLLVSSSPLTRSSYHASEDFDVLKRKRINKLI